MHTFKLTGGTLAHASTSVVAIPASEAIKAALVYAARGDAEVSDLNGNLLVGLGVQTSDDAMTWTDHTGGGEFILTLTNNMGWRHSTAGYTNLSGISNTVQFIRFVWYVQLTSGAALATAHVHGSVDAIARSQ